MLPPIRFSDFLCILYISEIFTAGVTEEAPGIADILASRADDQVFTVVRFYPGERQAALLTRPLLGEILCTACPAPYFRSFRHYLRLSTAFSQV